MKEGVQIARSKVEEVEKLHQAIPSGGEYEEFRTATKVKLRIAQPEVMNSKPLALRVATARQQLDRCAEREAEARTLANQAILAHEEAEKELEQAQKPMASLETELRHAPQPATAEEALQPLSPAAATLMDLVRTQQSAAPLHQQQAQMHLDQLMVGFRMVMDAKKAEGEIRAARPTYRRR